MGRKSLTSGVPPHAMRPFALMLGLAFALPALGLPTIPRVISGNVTVATAGDVMTIRNTPGAVINWNTFSIARPETVIFNQASASSRVFNRVTGNDPSELLGHMRSNGQVFLINPAGIFFGKDARIETAGFVASTLSMTDSDFIAGRMRFVATPGAADVVNEGRIVTPTGGKVFLVGTNVKNRGTISAQQGEAHLAAADAVEFADSSTPGVTVSLTTSRNEVLNSGKVLAESGRIGILGAVVKQQGELSAKSMVREGGRIFIRATDTAELGASSMTTASGTHGGAVTVDAGGTTLVSGQVETRGSSGKGGTVTLLGDNVGVVDRASVDASGKLGGGTVLVGGDYQGQNPAVRNARFTYLGADATIKADALTRGNGGKIILWADDSTRAFGTLSARGGARGGNGGFAEVSGKRGLAYQARTDLRAPRGKDGLLLLDPGNIAIAGGDGSPGGTMGGGPIFSTLGPALSTLDWDDIAFQLALSNVELRANAGGGIAFGGGTYNSASAKKLSLLAEGSISFTNADVNLGGTLEAYAGWDGVSPASLPLLTTPGQNISLYSGRLKANTVVLAATGSITDTTTAGPLNVVDAQTLKVKSTAGNIYMPGNNLARFASLTTGAGNIDFVSGAPMVTVDAATPTGNVNLSTTGGDIGLKLVSAPLGTVNVAAVGRILDDNLSYTTNIEAASVTLTSTGSNSSSFIAISADVVSPDVNAYVGTVGGYGGIDIRQNDPSVAATSVILDDTSLTAGYGNVRYSSRGAIPLNSAYSLTSQNGRVSVQSDGNISIDAPSLSSANGAVDIFAKGNLDVVGGGLSATGTALQLGAGGNATISAPVTANSVLVGGSPVGNLAIHASSTLTLDAPLTAADGNITLNGSSVNVTTNGGTFGAANAQNITVNGGNVWIEGALQAQFNVNVNAGTDLTVANGGTLAANGNVNVVAGRHVTIDGSSLVANNEISIQLASADSELRLNNGGVVSANEAGGPALIKLAFLARAADGILSDAVPIVFTPGVSNGFSNNFTVATPGIGMELIYSGTYNALSNDLYGTFGDGSSACHYRGGPCGGSYSPVAYADVSVEDSFKLFRDEIQGGGGQFGGAEGLAPRPRSRKPGTCN